MSTRASESETGWSLRTDPAAAMQRRIMHVDMDAFYASVEQRDDPALHGRAVIVGALPGGRGVVAACSYEARRFGVHSAMPVGEAYRRCPDAVYLRPRMAHYAAVSRQIRHILDEISPLVEAVSIDEAYLDLTGLDRLMGPPALVGARVKQLIRDRVGLSASVGIGPNRLVAKLASDHRKPDGLTVVAPEDVQGFLDPLPVASLRGVGERTLPLLHRLGIRSVRDLRGCSLVVLQEALGARTARALHAQAHGIGSAEVIADAARKSISRETTFAEDQTDPAMLLATLAGLAQEVAGTARRQHLAGRVVRLKVRYSGFETHTRQQALAAPTACERELFVRGRALLERGRLPAKPVRLIGIGLCSLRAPEQTQPDLFDGPDQATRDSRIASTMDAVNARFGTGALRFGVPAAGVRHNASHAHADRWADDPIGALDL